jgi:hypothetical protein
MRESLVPVNGFSAGLWLQLFGPGARRLEDDLLEIVATDEISMSGVSQSGA